MSEGKKRVKLTAGGQQYISECLRYTCPVCDRNFLRHPDRWKLHLEECTDESTVEEMIVALEKSEGTTKELLGELILDKYDDDERH